MLGIWWQFPEECTARAAVPKRVSTSRVRSTQKQSCLPRCPVYTAKMPKPASQERAKWDLASSKGEYYVSSPVAKPSATFKQCQIKNCETPWKYVSIERTSLLYSTISVKWIVQDSQNKSKAFWSLLAVTMTVMRVATIWPDGYPNMWVPVMKKTARPSVCTPAINSTVKKTCAARISSLQKNTKGAWSRTQLSQRWRRKAPATCVWE